MTDKGCVLLIEDTPSHQKLYSSWLGIGGYAVQVVADERTAQHQAATLQPDLIIVDIRLPWISGLDIIEVLKSDAATARIPVLALSVLDSARDESACYAAGADGYASKPIQIKSFLAQVEAVATASRTGG